MTSAPTKSSTERRTRSGAGQPSWPFVIVANRLPVSLTRRKGEKHWTTSPGGLVSALTPIAQRAHGAWVGWSGSVDDRLEPFEHDAIAQVPVTISRQDHHDFYQGFCNRTLWPLYHDAVQNPEYHRHWWRSYVAVNERFARMVAETVQADGAVWVQDYQLQLVPALLRALRPDLRIGFFLHIPFPPAELFARLPWRRQVLEGLLGADVIGFQTERNRGNFLRVVGQYTRAQASNTGSIRHDGRRLQAAAYPISIDFELYESVALAPDTEPRVERLRERLGSSRKVILGIDRLDYTKGIDHRLRAFHELLLSGLVKPSDAVMVQVAVPSRERVAEYAELRRRVEELVGQINGEFGEVGVAVVHYVRRNLTPENLVAMYRTGDVMMVTPLCDGMNLVAKEYVATRFDNSGTLVLSEFAGAAEELTDALLVNPHDVDGIGAAILSALTMDPVEAAGRMAKMRAIVRGHTVHDWARSFVADLVPARQRRGILGG